MPLVQLNGRHNDIYFHYGFKPQIPENVPKRFSGESCLLLVAFLSLVCGGAFDRGQGLLNSAFRSLGRYVQSFRSCRCRLKGYMHVAECRSENKRLRSTLPTVIIAHLPSSA